MSTTKKPPLVVAHSPALYGRIIAELRTRRLTQAELAARLGRHLNTVNQAILHGRNQATLFAVLEYLGIDPEPWRA